METHTQRSIKHCLDMIAPLEMPNGKLEDGWRQFYQFMVSLYRDMLRYEVLSRLGIEVYQEADEIHIIHVAHKQMMEGIEYLCKAPDSKYKWMNFLRLDF